MNLPNIDVFFINKYFKSLSIKRLNYILEKNKNKLASKAVLYFEDYSHKEIELSPIKKIISNKYQNLEINTDNINSELHSHACKVATRYLNFNKKYKSIFLKNLTDAHSNDFIIYLFIQPYCRVKMIAKKQKKLIKNIFILDCKNATSLFDRTHYFDFHKNISNQYLFKHYFPNNLITINNNINSYIKLLKGITVSNMMYLYKSLMRIYKLFARECISVNQGNYRFRNLVLITGNAESESLSFSKKLDNCLFAALPLASSDLKKDYIKGFNLKFLNIYDRLYWLFLFLISLPILITFFSFLSLLELLLIIGNIDNSYRLYLIYCLKNLPNNLIIKYFIKTITKKHKSKNIYSSNNIDSTLSIISQSSRINDIKHIVIQCTSKERITLPNYCDCDEYICESEEYGSFLRRNLPNKLKRKPIISWPTPLYKKYKQNLELINKTHSKNNRKTNCIKIGIPTQAEYIDLKPFINILMEVILEIKTTKKIILNIKLHPRESKISTLAYKKLSDNISFIRLENKDSSLLNWFLDKDIVIGSSSTVLYWAQCLGIPIISVIFKKNYYLKGLLPHLPENSLEFDTRKDFKILLKNEIIKTLNISNT